MIARQTILLVLTILSFFIIRTPANALEIDPYAGPRPIAVLIQANPWLNVIGSDTPMVAIYDDGQVIYIELVLLHWTVWQQS